MHKRMTITLDGPRRDINKKHELLDILFLTVSAVLSGLPAVAGG